MGAPAAAFAFAAASAFASRASAAASCFTAAPTSAFAASAMALAAVAFSALIAPTAPCFSAVAAAAPPSLERPRGSFGRIPASTCVAAGRFLSGRILFRAHLTAAAASKSATASAVRPQGGGARRAPPRRPRRRTANKRPRATATGAGSSFVAVNSARTGAAKADSRTNCPMRRSARGAWNALGGTSSGGILTHDLRGTAARRLVAHAADDKALRWRVW